MNPTRDHPELPASREMALAFLSSFRRSRRDRNASRDDGYGLAPPPPTGRPEAAAQPSSSPALQRLVQDRSRQQRREQEARAHQRSIQRAILRHEHRLAELSAELARAEVDYRDLQRAA